MLNKINDIWFKRYIPLNILRDSESLVIVASEWGSTLPQLLLCPRGKWACANREEKLQADCRPKQSFGTWLFPCFCNSYLNAEGEERGLSSSLWMLNGKGQSPFLPRSSMWRHHSNSSSGSNSKKWGNTVQNHLRKKLRVLHAQGAEGRCRGKKACTSCTRTEIYPVTGTPISIYLQLSSRLKTGETYKLLQQFITLFSSKISYVRFSWNTSL